MHGLPLPTLCTEHSPGAFNCCCVLTAPLAAGKYSEHAFQALDYLLDEASKYGIRLLLSLGNNWDHADSKAVVSCPLRLSAHVGSPHQAVVQLYTGLPVTTCSKPRASNCFDRQGLRSPASLYCCSAAAALLLQRSAAAPFLGLVACTAICLCWLAKLTSPPALQYVKWAGAKGPDAFFTDKKARKLFKDHIDVVVNRRNSINGRLYKEVSPWLQSMVWSIRSLKCMRRP